MTRRTACVTSPFGRKEDTTIPVLNLNIPAAVVPDLAAMCRLMFPIAADGSDPLQGLTNAQQGQKYIAAVLKSAIVSYRQSNAVASTKAAVDAAVTQANTDTGGIA